MGKTINWIKIKNEYLNTNISQRKLADKYKISFNTLKDRANREKWADLRKEQHNKIALKTQQITEEKIIQEEVDRITSILSTADALQEKIIQSMGQLDIYIDMYGKKHETDVIDVAKVRKLVSALKDLSEIVNKNDKTDNDKKLDKILEMIGGVI